jgi:glycosyltransferase involved in cell wall biosynthesis
VNLILADHTLKSYMGHSFEYARSVGDHARSLGHHVTTLAARQVSDKVVREIGAVPCFRFDLFHQYKLPAICSILPDDIRGWLLDEWNYFRHARRINQDLRETQSEIPTGENTLMLFPTMGFNDIEPVVRWAERLSMAQCPWIALVFHFTAYPDHSQPYHRAHYYTRALRYLEKSKRRSRFRLFTDSHELADEYREYTNMPLRVLPIPHAVFTRLPRPTPTRGTGAIRLTYLGDARTNKGFHLLPNLFESLQPEIRKNRMVGEIQANVRFAEEWQAVAAVRRLKRLDGVTLHERELTSSEYYELLHRADIVLLPYTVENYHTQTSGIFAEALAAGKPVIVPRGTWMARELKRNGAGTTFLPGDRRSLYEACVDAVEHFQPLQRDALRASAGWQQQHSPAKYLQLVMESLVADFQG